MTHCTADVEARRRRIDAYAGRIEIRPGEAIEFPGPLIALTSSRLGHDVSLHRRVCQFLSRSMLDSRDLGATLLVADGSAIHPWAVRAATLFGVPIAQVFMNDKTDKSLSRDAVLISIADRVDAVHVMRGGTIEKCLRERLTTRGDASTRVAVLASPKCAASGLIADGAIGWYLARNEQSLHSSTKRSSESNPLDSRDAEWMQTDNEWLIHCTRGIDGPWPGETMPQYRDAMLVDHPAASTRAPIDALERIVRSRQLIASAVATARAEPVVCFSAVSLTDLLAKRCFRPHLGRWDYEPFGVAIRMAAAKHSGIEPVIYGVAGKRKTLATADHYRFHPIGKTFDWRTEREWRSRRTIDLDEFASRDVRIFAIDSPKSRHSLSICPWEIAWLSVSTAK